MDVLIYVDSKIRELEGGVYLNLLLRKHGLNSRIASFRTEYTAIKKYTSRLVILPQINEPKIFGLAKLAKKMGCFVAVNPSEGTFGSSMENPSAWGNFREYDQILDVYFAWGKAHEDLLLKYTNLKNDKIKIIGPPRFDLYFPPQNRIFSSRCEFNTILNIENKASKNVLVALNFVNADKTITEIKRSYSYVLHGNNFIDICNSEKIHRDKILSAVFKISKLYPDVNFIIRPHPLEKREVYKSFIRECDQKNIYLSPDISIYTVLKNTDILINVCSTVSTEAWLIGLPTVSTIFDENIKYDSYFMKGNQIVGSYGELVDLIDYYIKGGKIPEYILKNRKEYLEYWYNSTNGHASEQCAKEIFDFLRTHDNRPESMISYDILKEDSVNFIKKIFGLGPQHPIRYIVNRDEKMIYECNKNVFNKNDVLELENNIKNILEKNNN